MLVQGEVELGETCANASGPGKLREPCCRLLPNSAGLDFSYAPPGFPPHFAKQLIANREIYYSIF